MENGLPGQGQVEKGKRQTRALGAGGIIAICVLVLMIGGLGYRFRHRVLRALRPQVAASSTTRPTTRTAARKPDRAGPRAQMLRERDAAIRSGDLIHAAAINAQLSQEALVRSQRVLAAWLTWQDPHTKLFPQDDHSPWWTYENTGADCFGFLLDVGLRLSPDAMPALQATLDAEARLAPPGELCQSVNTQTLAVEPESDRFEHYIPEQRRIFISSEYVKDGLLSVFERNGPNPSSQRMIQVLDNLVKHSTYSSKAGPIPSVGSEENGNIVQACTRLSFALNRDDYAELAARITEATITQMLPESRDLPVMDFDYEKNQIIQPKVKLRDHGNEMMPGLGEAFAMAVARSSEPKWKDRADRWAEPLARMYETFFRFGRDDHGMPVSVIHPRTRAILNAEPNDNWGYLLNGVLAFCQAERIHGALGAERIGRIEKMVESMTRLVASKYDLRWQSGEMDGYADTLESGMYMAAYRPSLAPVVLPWVDDQMANLFKFQRDNGFVDQGYLDGNFIRTALMYADLRSGGFTVQPWREDVSLGFAKDSAGLAVVIVKTKQPWTGTLRADRARHKDFLHLPWNWARLNSWPEWFVPDAGMKVIQSAGAKSTPSIDDLKNGWQLSLPANGSLTIRIDTGQPTTAPSAAQQR